jgi:ribosome-interacting GTPase 1
MGQLERIKEIEFEMSRTQKNKATEYHLGRLKARLAILRGEIMKQEAASKRGAGGEGFGMSLRFFYVAQFVTPRNAMLTLLLPLSLSLSLRPCRGDAVR